MRKMKRLCAACLAALALVTGCSGNNRSWVYKNGEDAPPAGVYISYLMSGISDLVTKLTEAGVTDASSMSAAELLAQTVDGQPAEQWVIAEAGKSAREYLAIDQQFAAESLTLPEGTEAQVANSVAGDWASVGAVYEENGIASSSMELALVNGVKKNALFSHYYDEGGKTPVPEQELKDILVRDYAKLRYLPIPKAIADETGEDGAVTATIDEQNTALRQKAEDYLARVKGGEALLDLITEYETAESPEAEPEAHTDDSHMIVLNKSLIDVYYSAELVNGAMAIPVGEAAVVEDPNYYYVMERADILTDPSDFASIRGAILSDLKSGEFDAMVEGWANALPIETNQAALDYYTPKRLKLE